MATASEKTKARVYGELCSFPLLARDLLLLAPPSPPEDKEAESPGRRLENIWERERGRKT